MGLASHTPWREIGYVRPKSWIGSLTIGIVFGCVQTRDESDCDAAARAPEINSACYLIGNRAALPGVVFTMIVARASEKDDFPRIPVRTSRQTLQE
jgi:hypothetical protein